MMDFIYRQALNACHVELRQYLDPQTILPNLNAKGLLTSNEEESLQNGTTQAKVDKIKELLPTKGEGWWDKFIDCLKETTQGTGHSTLLECLEDALKKLQQKEEKDSPVLKKVRPAAVGGVPENCHHQPQQQLPTTDEDKQSEQPEINKQQLETAYRARFKGFKEDTNGENLKAEQIHVLIETVNENEFFAVMMELKEGSLVTEYIIDDPLCGSKSYYFVGKWGDGEIPVAIIQTDMGSNGLYGSWYETKKALYNLPHLKYIFAVGVCGGIQGKVKMGQVIVSKVIWGYIDLKMAEPRWISRSFDISATQKEFYRYLSHPAHKPRNVKCGVMMSGPWLIKRTDIQKELLEICPEGIAFEMEGFGIAQACDGKVECLVVKGVCDFGNEEKNDNWQPQAATNAAKSLSDLMKDGLLDTPRRTAAED